MDKQLRNAYTNKPRGGSIQWQTDNAGELLRDSFFDDVPAPPVSGGQAAMFFMM
jgi:hypothetical protein